MPIIRFAVRIVGRLVGGIAAFFLLLLAIALAICLLGVGLACAVFTCWAGIHLAIYLSTHSHQSEIDAIHAILIASGCFGVLIVFGSFVGDLFHAARRKPALQIEFSDRSL